MSSDLTFILCFFVLGLGLCVGCSCAQRARSGRTKHL